MEIKNYSNKKKKLEYKNKGKKNSIILGYWKKTKKGCAKLKSESLQNEIAWLRINYY